MPVRMPGKMQQVSFDNSGDIGYNHVLGYPQMITEERERYESEKESRDFR